MKITLENRPQLNSPVLNTSKWWLTLILVSVCGLSTLLITMVLFYISHPEYYQNGFPSISRAAAFSPSRDVFAVGMCVAAFFGIISMFIVQHSNNSPYRTHDRTGRIFLWSTFLFCITANIFLALLAIVNSNWNGPLHELFSVLFFFAMIITYTLDAIWLLYQRKQRHYRFNPLDHVHRMGSHKLVISALLVGLGIVMFILYVVDKSNILTDDRVIHGVFVWFEYMVAAICFLLPITQYREQTAFWYALSNEGSKSSAEQ
jgi:hypothetical protein